MFYILYAVQAAVATENFWFSLVFSVFFREVICEYNAVHEVVSCRVD